MKVRVSKLGEAYYSHEFPFVFQGSLLLQSNSFSDIIHSPASAQESPICPGHELLRGRVGLPISDPRSYGWPDTEMNTTGVYRRMIFYT